MSLNKSLVENATLTRFDELVSLACKFAGEAYRLIFIQDVS